MRMLKNNNSIAKLRIIDIPFVWIAAIIVTLLLIGVMTNIKRKTSYVSCKTRLSIIGNEFMCYSYNHNGKYPMQISTNEGGTKEIIWNSSNVHASFIVPEYLKYNPKYLVCPKDSRKASAEWKTTSNTNISYYIVLDAMPVGKYTMLAGDRNIKYKDKYIRNTIFTNNKKSNITWEDTVGLHGNTGNILFTDMHVGPLNEVHIVQFVTNEALVNNKHLQNIFAHPANQRAIIGIP